MAESALLALDIGDDGIAGVLYREGKRAPVLLAAHYRPLADPGQLDEALAEVITSCRGSGCRCLVSVDAGHFFFRFFQLPFTDRKKIQSVLPYEIEDSVSFAGEPVVFTTVLAPDGTGGTEVLAVIAKNEAIRSWLERLRVHNLDPELLTVSGLPSALLIGRRHPRVPDDMVLLSIGNRRTLLVQISRRTVRALRVIRHQRLGLQPQGHIGSPATHTNTGEPPAADSAYDQDMLRRLTTDVANTLRALPLPPQQRAEPVIGLAGPLAMPPIALQRLAAELHADLIDVDWLPLVEFENREVLTKAWPPAVFSEALALVSCPAKERERLNFRRNEFAQRGAGQWSLPVRLAVLAAAAVFVAVIIMQVVDYRSLQRERDRLVDRLATMYQETVPSAGQPVDPLRELRVRVNELKETAAIGAGDGSSLTVVALLADISERIAPSLNVSFERLVFDRTTIRIRGLTDTFNSVDQMKQALEQSPFFSGVSIGSAHMVQREQVIRFELRLDLMGTL